MSLVSAPILSFPDFTLPFELYVDASLDGLGMTLGQIQSGKEVVIAYAGRSLNSAELSYSATEKEALAVIDGIKKFEPYLHGRKFVGHTDHNALKWLMSVKDVTGRLARWSLYIQQFDFKIKHCPGIANGNADGLSRRSYSHTHLLAALNPHSTEIERIHEMQCKDSTLEPMITYLETKTLPEDEKLGRTILQQCDQFFMGDDGLLYHLWSPTGRSRTDTKIQLTVPASLCFEILKSFHDNPLGGHLGLKKTYDKIRAHYYWYGMFADIQHWVRSCIDCQMRKTPRNQKKAPLLPIPVDGAFHRLAVDCLGPFAESYSGNRYVVVFSDYLTRWPEAFAVSTTDAPVIAKLLINEIFCRHGSPKTLLSDRGKNFLSKLIREVCKLLRTDKLNTSPYHPETDGLVERFNSYISQSLSMYVSTNQKDWDEFLPSILFVSHVTPSDNWGFAFLPPLWPRTAITLRCQSIALAARQTFNLYPSRAHCLAVRGSTASS